MGRTQEQLHTPDWHDLVDRQPEGGPATDDQLFAPLDPGRFFWRDLFRREAPTSAATTIDPSLRSKSEPVVASHIAPPSAELVAHERQLAINAVYDQAEADNATYDAMVDEANARNRQYDNRAEANMRREANAMNEAFDRRANRLGAIGVLAYLHPDIRTRSEAIEQRTAFEQRDSSAANYLTHFAKETLAARWHQVGHAVGKFASKLFVRPPEPMPVAEAAPAGFASASDEILAEEIRGYYTPEELELIRRAVRASHGELASSQQ
jgi:hypothetical protein